MHGSTDPQPRPRWSLGRLIWLILLVGLPIIPLMEIIRVLIGPNTHALLDGRVYRTAQPSPERLQALVQQHGIRTVVNLRGCNIHMPWYQEEMQVTNRLDVGQEDLYFSAGRLPSSREVTQLVEVFDRAEYPVLLHCWRGADRTGLAAAIAVLLHPGSTLGQARAQMSVRYGHVALGRPANLDEFLDAYEQWLQQRRLTHEPRHFRHWAQHEYRGLHCLCQFESCTVTPAALRVQEPFAVHVRAHNASNQPWHFKSTRSGGVHLGVVVLNEFGREQITNRSGLRNLTVLPGESVDLVAPLPGLNSPGSYRLFLDLVDEQMGWFYQMGSDPLERELIVRE